MVICRKAALWLTTSAEIDTAFKWENQAISVQQWKIKPCIITVRWFSHTLSRKLLQEFFNFVWLWQVLITQYYFPTCISSLESPVFSKDLHRVSSALMTFTDIEMKWRCAILKCFRKSGQEMQQAKFCNHVKYILLQPHKIQPSAVSSKATQRQIQLDVIL